MSDISPRRLTRRGILGATGAALLAGLGGAMLSACAAPAPAAPTSAPSKPAEAPKPTEAPKPAAAAPTTAPAAGGQTINLSWFTPAAPGLEQDFYTSFKDDFMKRNPGYKVEVSFEAWNDYFVKLPTVLAGGLLPDVNHLHCSIAQDYGTKGAMKDMFPFIDADKIPRDTYFAALIKQMSDYKTHTKLWAVPKDSAAYGIYFNKEMFDKAKVEYPKMDWTLKDLVETAKKLTVDKKGVPATDPKFDPTQIAQWGWQWMDPLPSGDVGFQFAAAWAGPWYSDDMLKAQFDDAKHAEYVQMLADMRCKDKSSPAAGDALGQGDPFRNGLTAMKVDHHQNVFFMNAEKKTFKYDCVLTPKGDFGQFIGVACSGWTMPAKAKQPEHSWKFIKFLTSEEKQCEIVSSKRWGSGVVKCEEKLMPNDNNPPNFKPVFLDPLIGKTPVKVEPIPYPPFLSEIKQVFSTEFDAVVNCGKVTAAEACKKAQPQIQALLDKGAKL